MSRRVYACRCDTETPKAMAEIARLYGCVYMGKGGELEPSVGLLMDRIAQGKLRVVPVDPSSPPVL